MVIDAYRRLAQTCKHALHVGLTEAGMGRQGIMSPTAALALPLREGIGDTICVSLTPEPNADRAEEVRVCWQILQSLGLRHRSPTVTACHGCGRTTSTFFRELASSIQKRMDKKVDLWRKTHPGVEELNIAVMGCVVKAR